MTKTEPIDDEVVVPMAPATPSSDPGDGLRGPVGRRPAGEVFERYAGVLLLLALMVGFTIALPGTFLTHDNLIGVVSNQTIVGIVALGLLGPLATGVFDISIGGMMTLSMVVVTILFQNTDGAMPVPAAIAITLLIGALVGAVNGFLVVKVGVDAFVATIATGSVLLGVSGAVADGQTISQSIPERFTELGRGDVHGIPYTVFYFAILALALWYLLEMTPVGRRIYATGAGREAARLAGVRTDRITFWMFVLSATFATTAGIVYSARIGSAPPNVGASYLLPAFAAAFLGATMIRPGRFNVPGLIVAMFIVAVGINGLQLLGMAFWVVDIFQGTALIIAVVLAKIRRPGAAVV
jgi:ribose transport system permease protein